MFLVFDADMQLLLHGILQPPFSILKITEIITEIIPETAFFVVQIKSKCDPARYIIVDINIETPSPFFSKKVLEQISLINLK